MQNRLDINHVHLSYGERKILEDVAFNSNGGTMIGLTGPNASGKSTLLKSLAGLLRPRPGHINLNGSNVHKMKAGERAQNIALVSQDTEIGFAFSAEQIVMMGRTPYMPRFQSPAAEDLIRVREAMNLTGTLPLAERAVNTLSGGERQRVLIARALAQEPHLLLMDEPIAHLDISHQFEILNVLKELCRQQKIGIVIALHDLNLAAQYCDWLLLLHERRIFAQGKPAEVLTASNIEQVYGARVLISSHPSLNCPQISYASPFAGRGLRRHVHVVCGGGSGRDIIKELIAYGYTVSAGVLNQGDSDWQTCRDLQVEMAQVPAFSEITREAAMQNLGLMRKSDLLLLTSVPFGRGNLANLEILNTALEAGGCLLLADRGDFSDRDYTGGRAASLYARIKGMARAVTGPEPHDLIEIIAALPESK